MIRIRRSRRPRRGGQQHQRGKDKHRGHFHPPANRQEGLPICRRFLMKSINTAANWCQSRQFFPSFLD